MARLERGLPDAVERAIAFLQADPWCDRSGYEKAGLIRYVKRAPLTEEQMQDLRGVVLMVVDRRYRLEFKHYCRLARRVCSPDLLAALVSRAKGPDPHIARRATWVLHSLQVSRPGGMPIDGSDPDLPASQNFSNRARDCPLAGAE